MKSAVSHTSELQHLEVESRDDVIHGEYQYLDALRKILNEGEVKNNRTGIPAYSLFGMQLRFDLRDGYPLLTTKKMAFKSILKELLFFISGSTNTQILEDQGVNIWKGNTSREFLDGRGLTHLPEKDMGRMYGAQWRHADGNDSYTGIDQLSQMIEGIKKDPHSRRHLISTWNVGQLDEMALLPCHVLFQLNVSNDQQYLDGMLTCRSNDMGLGAPFNIASYAALMIMIGHLVSLTPRYYIHSIGDAHIYENHKNAVEKQLTRTPYPFPRLKIQSNKLIRTIDDFTIDDLVLEDYISHPGIKMDMAI